MSSSGPDAVTIGVLTGDFLMPLLSAIDKGRGMMKMLNRTPVDYLIWGNHEDNLSPADVFFEARVRGHVAQYEYAHARDDAGSALA